MPGLCCLSVWPVSESLSVCLSVCQLSLSLCLSVCLSLSLLSLSRTSGSRLSVSLCRSFVRTRTRRCSSSTSRPALSSPLSSSSLSLSLSHQALLCTLSYSHMQHTNEKLHVDDNFTQTQTPWEFLSLPGRFTFWAASCPSLAAYFFSSSQLSFGACPLSHFLFLSVSPPLPPSLLLSYRSLALQKKSQFLPFKRGSLSST